VRIAILEERREEALTMTPTVVRNALVLSVLSLAACRQEPLAVSGSATHTLTAMRGQEVDVTLSTVGPGQYDSLPSITGLAVRFLDMSFVGPFLPSGPTQKFRFQAAFTGQATIVFRHTESRPEAIYVVDVH
jgi:hypothetical protein